MKNKQKGYSLIVMIIAVVVILIIAGGAISIVNISMEEKRINNFIYDINNIEAAVREYYSSTGIIPSEAGVSDISVLSSQLDSNDSGTYYTLDLSKLELTGIHNKEKTFVVNEGSLKVYMLEGVAYKGDNYYTVNDELMGTNTTYEKQNFDLICTISPTVWTEKVNIRAILPDVESYSGWTFKYSKGPKEVDYFQDNGTAFTYGTSIEVTSNGVYTIYVKDDAEDEIVKNVVVKNIDNIYPKYVIENGNFTFSDDETGIKEIRYKTYEHFLQNVTNYNGTNNNALEYYLLDGKGKTIQSIKTDISSYKTRLRAIQSNLAAEEANFNALADDDKEVRRDAYNANVEAFNNQEEELEERYSYILDDSMRYVLYVEDYAGNATIVNESTLTFGKVRQTFSIEM